MPVGSEWVAEPLRFWHLQRWIAAVRQKTLTQPLRTLEQDGLMLRTVTPTVPVMVHYQLMFMDSTLLADIGPLRGAGSPYNQMEEALRRYDSALFQGHSSRSFQDAIGQMGHTGVHRDRRAFELDRVGQFVEERVPAAEQHRSHVDHDLV